MEVVVNFDLGNKLNNGRNCFFTTGTIAFVIAVQRLLLTWVR